MSVNWGGGMQKVLKRKNMYLEGFQVIFNFNFPSKSCVLDHSENIDVHIEKGKKCPICGNHKGPTH